MPWEAVNGAAGCPVNGAVGASGVLWRVPSTAFPWRGNPAVNGAVNGVPVGKVW